MLPDPPDTVDWVEQDAARKNAGQYTNRLFVQHMGDGLVRLNFGEIFIDTDPNYHTAVVMTASNALSFAELMTRMAYAALGMPPVPSFTANAMPTATDE